jgi:hypothetical protein
MHEEDWPLSVKVSLDGKAAIQLDGGLWSPCRVRSARRLRRTSRLRRRSWPGLRRHYPFQARRVEQPQGLQSRLILGMNYIRMVFANAASR